jgi:hypothetical protein
VRDEFVGGTISLASGGILLYCAAGAGDGPRMFFRVTLLDDIPAPATPD